MINLHEAGYGVTSLDAQGALDRAKLIFTLIKRKGLPDVSAIIHQCNPHAFVSVEEIRSASGGIFPVESLSGRRYLDILGLRHKRK